MLKSISKRDAKRWACRETASSLFQMLSEGFPCEDVFMISDEVHEKLVEAIKELIVELNRRGAGEPEIETRW